MDFQTREQYLAAVSEWKIAYKELSAKIRAIKAQIKDENRKLGYSYAWSQLMAAKSNATGTISWRRDAKIEAQRQYLEARQK